MANLERGENRGDMQTHVLKLNTAELQLVLSAVANQHDRERHMRIGAHQSRNEVILFGVWLEMEQYSRREIATRQRRKEKSNA